MLGPLRRMARPDPQSPHPFNRPTSHFRGTSRRTSSQARGTQPSSSPCNGNRSCPDPYGRHSPISRHPLRSRHIPSPASKAPGHNVCFAPIPVSKCK
ncbi:hypothetical protein N657DRAFT_244202 [Parathielavia appendiculata]|uniref:Uncharacterized protein n=1 Tax=Parathielavia appendiculata TaxID=2587402 RepID=A0AAN6TSJ2_9PEZI|nr:hypothetical protein N657DRAFT_244202 [Parathielavia appendiculata]